MSSIYVNIFFLLLATDFIAKDVSAYWPHPEPDYETEPEPEYYRKFRMSSKTPNIGFESTKWYTTVTDSPIKIEPNTQTYRPVTQSVRTTTVAYRPQTYTTRSRDQLTTTTTQRPFATIDYPSKPVVSTFPSEPYKPTITNFPSEPSSHSDYNEFEEIPIESKKCQMVCRQNRLNTREWRGQTFWKVIKGEYSCRMQKFGKMLLGNDKYCDLFINSVDPSTNITQYYCTHSSVLSLVSERLRKDVSEAIEEHIRDVSRDRDRLPNYDWPPLPQQVIKSILEYIYTNQITGFNPEQNIFGLYVGAFTADLSELMTIIEDYLNESFNAVQQLNQFVTYFLWAHNTNNTDLKERLFSLGSKILKMSEQQFAKFIKDICESNGYNTY